jgi:hypothetical protein
MRSWFFLPIVLGGCASTAGAPVAQRAPAAPCNCADDPAAERSDTPRDAQFLEPDDYIVLDAAYDGSGWAYGFVAKMVKPARAETKNEAQFLGVSAKRRCRRFWSAHFYRTRPARAEDVAVGRIAFALDAYTDEQGVYLGPSSRDEIEEAPWFIGTIDDVSELYKGLVSLAGYKVSVRGLRAPE